MAQIINRKPRLYLAYGSNLNREAMRWRCPDAKPVRGYVLIDGARLVFRGCADVMGSPGMQAPCGLWLISHEDEQKLDIYEGVSHGLYLKETIDLGSGRTALIYLMTAPGIFPPSARYFDSIRRGYRDFGIPMHYLKEAHAHSFDSKEPCEYTLARRRRQKNSTNKSHHRLVKMPERIVRRQLDLRLEREDKGLLMTVPFPVTFPTVTP